MTGEMTTNNTTLEFISELSAGSNSNSDGTTTFTIGTAQPSTGGDSSSGMPSGVLALLLGLLAFGVATFVFICYLKRTGKLARIIPFKRLVNERRSSVSSSRRPLDVDDHQTSEMDHSQLDDLPRTREGEMFTIDDFEPDTGDDYQSRGTNDEYFYDEVFGKSVFEDEVTNASMRELYMTSEQEDAEMFDVDAIVNSITGVNPKSPTSPKT